MGFIEEKSVEYRVSLFFHDEYIVVKSGKCFCLELLSHLSVPENTVADKNNG